MYTVECDNCKSVRGEGCEYSCWNDENYAVEEATDNEWIEDNGKHYCPDCYTLDSDDNIVLKINDENQRNRNR